MKQSIINTHPEIVSQWHKLKNGNLYPDGFTKGSHTKIWWHCEVNDNHVWYAQIKSRTNGNGCPICGKEKSRLSRLKPKKGESLAEKYPNLAKEWNFEKNGAITPFDINAGTSKKFWWKCNKGQDHIWEANVVSRTKGNGCSVCAGRIVIPLNSLAIKNPQLASEWHPTKNGNLTPLDITLASPKKVWWKCPKGSDHEWQAKISNRSSLNQGCSVCSNRTVVLSNCLATTHPQLAKEWDNKKNSLTPFDVVAGNHSKIYWKCLNDKKHSSYLSSIDKRVANRNCPKCGEINRRTSKAKPKYKNSLGDLFPKIVKEWHPTNNGKLTPFDVNAKSHRKVWWICPQGIDHEWEAVISSRTSLRKSNSKATGCAICSGKKVVASNCLTTTHPHLLKELHPTKNGDLNPDNIFSGSHKKIWWKCLKNPNHPDWRTEVRHRAIKNTGCDYCWPTPQSKEELIIIFELKYLFPSVDPSGLKAKINEKKYSADIYIKEFNLIIEYDGIYWHRKKEDLDTKKTQVLINSGYNVIRIRQAPLTKINEDDIIYEGSYKGKVIVNMILEKVLSRFNMSKHLENKIKEYLGESKLQNKKEFDRYVSEALGDKKIIKIEGVNDFV